MSYDDDDVTFKVVVNETRQASMWPADRALPRGWTETGRAGSKEECLAEIDRLEGASRFGRARSRRRARLTG
jgi:MbtH protein